MSEFPSVTVERDLDAPVESVFLAWTDPSKLRQWFHSAHGTTVESAEIDLRVGGEYRVVVRDPDGTYTVIGAYSRVEPPSLLEFTWQWETSSLEPAETLVLLELTPLGNRTRLRLTHSRFSTERSSQAHSSGWEGVLATLVTYLESEKTS